HLPVRSSSMFITQTPRPPSSTLFPYTTLFRSRRGRRSGAPGRSGERRIRRPDAHLDRAGDGGVRRGREALAQGLLAAGPASLPLDRKSTRLNSSHLGISYAVFCLKKKKIKKRI